MRLYFAGAENYHKELWDAGARDFLVTLAYDPEKIVFIRKTYPGVRIMIDSGAFTFYNKGANMTPEKWLSEYSKYFQYGDEVIGLDVIYNGPASLSNYLHIRKEYPNVLPTYHVGEPLDIFDEYAALTKRVAVGGLVNNPDPNREWYIKRIFEKYRDTLAIHAFGVTKQDYLKRYPFASCDSTTWNNPSIYGETHYYREGRLVKVRSPKLSGKVSFQGKPAIFDREYRLAESIRAMVQYNQFITRLWKARGVQVPEVG